MQSIPHLSPEQAFATIPRCIKSTSGLPGLVDYGENPPFEQHDLSTYRLKPEISAKHNGELGIQHRIAGGKGCMSNGFLLHLRSFIGIPWQDLKL